MWVVACLRSKQVLRVQQLRISVHMGSLPRVIFFSHRHNVYECGYVC
jgi:hypothetical protein